MYQSVAEDEASVGDEGEITVESAVGRGTTFTIKIPLAPEMTQDQTQAKSKEDKRVRVISLR